MIICSNLQYSLINTIHKTNMACTYNIIMILYMHVNLLAPFISLQLNDYHDYV